MGMFKETDWKPMAPRTAGDLRSFFRTFPGWSVEVEIESDPPRSIPTSKTAVRKALRGLGKYNFVTTRLDYETDTIYIR